MKNYYNILGISRNATSDEIRKAYRNLALQFHPDRSGSDTHTENFKDINEAKQVLLDRSKRFQYDQLLAARPTNIASKIKGNGYGSTPYFRYSTIPKKPVYIALFLVIVAFGVIYLITQMEYQLPVKDTASFELPLQVIADNADSVEAGNTATENTAATAGKANIEASKTNPIDDSIKALLSSTLPGLEQPAEQVSKQKPAVSETRASGKATVAVQAETSPANNKQQPAPVAAATKPAAARPKPIAAAKPPVQPAAEPKTKVVKTAVAPPKVETKTVKAEPVKASVTRELAAADMQQVLANISREKAKYHSSSNCVQFKLTSNSNVKNGFKLAEFLRKNGYILSGRETINGNVQGIAIDARSSCVKVTVGTL